MHGLRGLAWRLLALGLMVGVLLPLSVSAQSVPRLKPLPPKKDRVVVAAQAQARALAVPSTSLTSSAPLAPQGSWQDLPNQPPVLDFTDCGPGSPLLLTDGTVMVADNGCQDFWKLTPDQFGSYVNGTWTQLASLPADYSPLYHASAVLPDGRVIIEGGEYNFLTPVWTNQGAIYDPQTDTWTEVAPPSGWDSVGDAPGVVLFDGTFMLGNCCTVEAALLNPETLTWTATGSGKFDTNNEEGWTLLPNKQVLAVDAYVPINIPYIPAGTNSEVYVPGSGKWHSAGSTIVQLWDSWLNCGELSQEPKNGPTFELGPAVLRPDGTVFYTGSNTCGPGFPGHTAIYNSYTGSWKAGPDFPGALNISDGPAVLEPNGKVLVMASPGFGDPPTTFLEWDGKHLTVAPPSPNASFDGSFYGNFLVLPTGQILLTDFFTVSLYTPVGFYNPAWAPVILSVPLVVSPGGSYIASGLQFNGMSQGAAYGDDAQDATNYPLVRITNLLTGHVFYSRTHDHSSMAVGFGGHVSTHFDVPAGQEPGLSKLEVVANGIPSLPVWVWVK
jgi:hypothetical protein